MGNSSVFYVDKPLKSSQKHVGKYRVRGLDGIRALACIAVLLYHFLPGKMIGGFLGVDVFFVLSGFLITAILAKQLNKTSTIDLKVFWLRRIRRLLPAIVAAVVFIIPLANFAGSDALVGIKRQVLGAVTFSYNWVQIFFGTSYFTQQTPELFTNVWSLAVEQQFYIIWPVLLIMLWKLPKTTRPLITLALSVASALELWWLYNPSIDPSRVYMGTDTHAFGLMMGATLALLLPKPIDPCQQKAKFAFVRGALGYVGIVAILVSFYYVSDHDAMTYPLYMVLACIATLLVIQALQDDVVSYSSSGMYLAKILDSKVLVWLGERSYGIYLWHWPIWVLAILVMPTINIYIVGVLASVVSIIAAHLSYRYIETPMRVKGIFPSIRQWLSNRIVVNDSVLAQDASKDGEELSKRDIQTFTIKSYSLTKMVIPVLVVGVLVSSLFYAFSKEPPQTSAESYIKTAQEKAGDKEKKTKTAQELEAERLAKEEANKQAQIAKDLQNIDGSQISVIGDSVTLASKPSLEQLIPGISVDGAVSRSIWSGIEIINAQKEQGTLGKVVVISLATNSAVSNENLQDILDAIGPDRYLVLVTAFGPARTTWIPPSNQVIRQFASEHKDRVRVADWENGIKDHTDYLAGDLVHPDGNGGNIYAQSVLDAINSFKEKPQN